jgi:glycosyltransferase involved in cell wall biosynthesis
MKTNLGEGRAIHGRERILFIANHSPYPPANGPKLRIWSLVRALAANGYAIDLICIADRTEPVCPKDSIHALCRSVEVIQTDWGSLSRAREIFPRLPALMRREPYGVARCRSTGMRRAILSRLQQGDVDFVFCGETYVLANLPANLAVPLIVDHHNAEHILLSRYISYERNPAKRAYAALEAANLRRWEQYATQRSNLALVCSEQDRRIYTDLNPAVPIAVVPNAIDTDAYDYACEEDPRVVLYTGGMDWYPNRDAVEHFISRILPKLRTLAPGVKFVVGGRNPSAGFLKRFAGIPDIEFTGTVADMRPQIARAAVSVVPLRIGSGTRLKILEAAAMRKPVVSTSIGAEGLDFADGREILLADEPESFAAAVASLLSDVRRRRSLGVAARERVEHSYSLPALQAALSVALGALAPCS